MNLVQHKPLLFTATYDGFCRMAFELGQASAPAWNGTINPSLMQLNLLHEVPNPNPSQHHLSILGLSLDRPD